MDAKLIKLIEIIRNERQIAPAELAERLGVSVRTVRTYVNRINALLAESDNAAGDRRSAGRIEMKSSSTYRFEGVDPSLLDELLGTGEEHQSADGTRLPETTEGRVAYLMNDLLYRADWITIDDLAQILFVSRATVSEDLKEVEQRLGRFDLSIERRPRYGIRVVGPEIKRRLCLAALAASGSVPAAACATRSVQDVINAIDAYVGEVTERGDFQINALARQNLLVHIAVSVMRIRESCYVPMEDEQLGRIRATREFLSYSFMGDDTPVKTWKEMEVGVLRSLCDLDLGRLYSISEGSSFPGSAFEHEERQGYSKVSDGLFVKSSTSTCSKIELLKRLFELLDVDKGELLIKMTPGS